MVSVAVDQLGEVVGSLAQERQIIADALVAGYESSQPRHDRPVVLGGLLSLTIEPGPCSGRWPNRGCLRKREKYGKQ
jgi:hypothetical protein